MICWNTYFLGFSSDCVGLRGKLSYVPTSTEHVRFPSRCPEIHFREMLLHLVKSPLNEGYVGTFLGGWHRIDRLAVVFRKREFNERKIPPMRRAQTTLHEMPSRNGDFSHVPLTGPKAQHETEHNSELSLRNSVPP